MLDTITYRKSIPKIRESIFKNFLKTSAIFDLNSFLSLVERKNYSNYYYVRAYPTTSKTHRPNVRNYKFLSIAKISSETKDSYIINFIATNNFSQRVFIDRLGKDFYLLSVFNFYRYREQLEMIMDIKAKNNYLDFEVRPLIK